MSNKSSDSDHSLGEKLNYAGAVVLTAISSWLGGNQCDVAEHVAREVHPDHAIVSQYEPTPYDRAAQEYATFSVTSEESDQMDAVETAKEEEEERSGGILGWLFGR